jgi:hypothetical protein
VEKINPNFVKDILTVYVNFIMIVIVVSEKEIGGLNFVPPFVCHTTFQAVTAVSSQITFFRFVITCCVEGVYQRFGGVN